uniref:C-type lectin domain-containing protein n=1 Tax=Gasterosteus aculeatus aculeatus TaxID=481459 RepID=A0AAQ4QIY7_GASAC
MCFSLLSPSKGSVCVLLQVAHQAGKSSSAKTDGVKLSGTLFSPQTVSDFQYILMKVEYDWMTASSYCSEHYQGLATITTQENITRINSLMKAYPTRAAWIGLYDDVSGWKWSLPDEGVTAGAQKEFWNWQQGQPDNNGSDERCVSMTAGGLWRDNSCTLVGHTDMFECYVTRGATEENRFHLACLTVCGSS